MEREDILFIIAIVLLTMFSFYFGYNYKSIGDDTNEIKQMKLYRQNTNCSGMDIFMTSECLNLNLKEFFFYNLSQVGKELSLQELFVEGGVCSHAAKYYKDNAEELGFYGTTCVMDVYEENTTLHQHEIAIVSNKEGYVILDQKNIVGYGYFDINISGGQIEE